MGRKQKAPPEMVLTLIFARLPINLTPPSLNKYFVPSFILSSNFEQFLRLGVISGLGIFLSKTMQSEERISVRFVLFLINTLDQ